MKETSIQFKFFGIVISAILAITIFVGGVSIYETDLYVQQQTNTLINTTCANETLQINQMFDGMEKSVRIMESYVLSLFDSISDAKDPAKQREAFRRVDEMFADVARHTDGAAAYYLRFDPAISDGKAGVFYSKMDGGDEYICLEPTDILLYDKDDIEHVGWFWVPYEAGEPVWMNPYYNQNNNIFMISYVVPLYCDNQFIGVVGMDFDFDVLANRIHGIKIYENGFAHLELNGVVIHGDEITQQLSDPSARYLHVSGELVNGMVLVLFANYDDIQQVRYTIAFKIAISVLLLVLVFSLIVFFMVKKIVTPLKKLTDASIKLANGDYDVEIMYSDTREINLLSTAFDNMAMNLREHENMQRRLAYCDSMTGLRNTTAYKEWILDINKRIPTEDISFGIVVLDINYLKETNDTYGHNVGNDLIITASQIISDTFKRSPVFRIGGDEFVVILQNRDLEERDLLLERFDMECADARVDSRHGLIHVQVAKGCSLFDPATDKQFSDVFNRADDAMYRNKKMLKTAFV